MSERRWGNFSSCCRLCLSEKLGTLKSIFEDASRSREIVKNIRICLGVEIQANDKLSTMICEQCLSKVNSWNDYRKFCSENQSKLLGWMNIWTSSNIADISIQIKDEVVEDGEERRPPQVIIDDDDVIQVKPEPVENAYEAEPIEEDIYDLPPPLTPHPPDEHRFVNESDEEGDESNQTNANESAPYLGEVLEVNGLVNGDEVLDTPRNIDGRKCRMCDKVFSSAGNRRKHENMIHRRKEKNTNSSKGNESARSKENADVAQNKQGPNSAPAEPSTRTRSTSGNETEIQKIQFAAGLQLQQKSTNSSQQVPIENMPLTKVEVSYLEKCKVIVKMTDTLTCACHDERFEDLKDLFAHLKKQRTWFAMFTCYNCLITFGDRSSYMKHYCHCPRDLLQNLKRLSESPVNPEIKIRLYQSYKCIRCNCIFSFHEDFCSHFDVEHMEMLQDAPPYICLCSKSFNEVEEYKQHLHISCFLRYFCDICFGAFPSMDAFKAHCENEHDSAEGSTVDSYDTFHKCRLINQEVAPPPSSSKRSLPVDDNSSKENAEDTRSKRRRTVNLPVTSAPELEPEDPDYVVEPHKVINPHALRNIKSSKPTSCPAPGCGKLYSSYHNMLRHYKLSHDRSGKILVCMYCPQKFRLISELKEHEAIVHGKETDVEENVVKTPPNQGSDQFKFSCPECGDLFKSLDEWKKHMEKHPKKTCTECGKQFALQAEFDQHRSAHLNIKVYRDAKTQGYKSTMVSPILICEICDKTFNTKSELRQHKLLHEKMPVLSAHDSLGEEKKDLSKKYSCTTCNKHYVSYGGIWDHNKKHHSGQQIATEYPRKCNRCAKVVTSKGAWVNHLRMHERLLIHKTTPKNTQVDVAPTNINRTPKARVVKNSDDSESYYTCKRCFKVFSSKYNLRNHMKCHGIVLNPSSRSSSKTGKIIKTYWCDVCHQACPGFAELQEHKQEHRNENVPKQTNPTDSVEPKKSPLVFACDTCTLTFSTNFALRRHKEKHAMEQSDSKPKQIAVYCKYCKIPFQNLDELNEHMANEHDQPVTKPKQQQQLQKKSGRKFPCNLCKKVFDNAGALSSHQGWHKRGTFGKKILKSQEKVVRTMLKQIPPQSSTPAAASNRYQCYTCSQQFVNDTALQIHILESHRNVNATVLNCNSCKLSFESKSAYDTHMQLHKVVENQKNMKPHPCKYCPAGFSRSDTLNAHVRQHHKEHYSDAFKCTQCDRVFDKQNALTIHLKVHDRQRHSGENTPKPIHNKNIYFCSICDVGFAVAKDLRNHVVTAHPF